MPSNTTVLVTGANRGIGKDLVEAYLLRQYHTVIAAVRDPSHSTSQSLSCLPVGIGSSLIVVPLDNSSDTSPFDGVNTLKTKHSITSLDVVIANAGIAHFYGTVLQTPLEGTRDHLNINTLAALALFQATYPLLSPSAKGSPISKLVTISSAVGSVGEMEHWPMTATAYGASKAALKWITKNIHIENPELIAFPMHPGWVQTDKGNAGALANGMKEAPLTLKLNIDGIISQIDQATREKTSGKFVSFDNEKFSW